MFITENIFYVGVNDHKTDLFEGQYVVPNGMSYNSYVIMDEKIAVMDTVDQQFGEEWLGNVASVLHDKKPDYLIVHHMEPDHCANILKFADAYPDTLIVGNAKTFNMMANFFRTLNLEGRKQEVGNGDTLSLGKHTLTFVFAPMVHWPEVMMCYESTEQILFSADAFGTFGALDVEQKNWEDEARRYYIGIVGKYGLPVQSLFKNIAGISIQTICPLHGPVLKENLGYYIEKYQTWSSYLVETDGIMIAYSSIYGDTKEAVEILAAKLKEKGANVVVYDLARTDLSEAVAKAFQYGKLVLASVTYNADIFPFMRNFIEHLMERNYQNRTIAMIENGSWAPMAARVMKGMLEKNKNITYVEPAVTVYSSVSDKNIEELEALAVQVLADK